MKVVDLMTTEVIAVSRDTGLGEAARLMLRNQVSGLPIIDTTVTGTSGEAEQEAAALPEQAASASTTGERERRRDTG